MNRFVRIGLFGVLALSVCLLTSAITRGDDDDDAADIKEAAKATDALKKLVEAIEAGKEKDIPKLADELNKKTDLKHIMWSAYKPRKKGGLGVGAKPGTIRPDGIEAKIISMSKKPLPANQLQKESEDLIKMAEVSKAIAEIADRNAPQKDEPKKPKADWKKFNDLQKKSSKELIDAVKAKDPDKVLDATKNLYSSCTNCHSVFRGD